MSKGADTVEESVNEALSTESEATADETVESKETQGSEKEEKVTGKGKGAVDRIKELVEVKNNLESRLQQAQEALEERASALSKLTDLLDAKEEDSALLDQLRVLATTDPDARERLEWLDKRMKGIEEDVESGKTTPEKGDEKARKLLEQTRDVLQDQIADQRSDLIVARAEPLVDKYIENLPEEYDDKDRVLVHKLFVDETDWETIEEDPDSLRDKLAEGMQKALDIYGEPRGAIRKQVLETNTETEKTETPSKSVEDFVSETLNKDWAELKTVKTPRGEIVQPAISDEDFSRQAASVMKALREAEEKAVSQKK